MKTITRLAETASDVIWPLLLILSILVILGILTNHPARGVCFAQELTRCV